MTIKGPGNSTPGGDEGAAAAAGAMSRGLRRIPSTIKEMAVRHGKCYGRKCYGHRKRRGRRRDPQGYFRQNAFAHFEIAAYKSLLAMCSAAGAEGAKPLLEQSLSEERRMADWIDANLEKVTLQYLEAEQRRLAA